MGKIKEERKNKKQGKVILQKRKREGSEGHGNSEEKKDESNESLSVSSKASHVTRST